MPCYIFIPYLTHSHQEHEGVGESGTAVLFLLWLVVGVVLCSWTRQLTWSCSWETQYEIPPLWAPAHCRSLCAGNIVLDLLQKKCGWWVCYDRLPFIWPSWFLGSSLIFYFPLLNFLTPFSLNFYRKHCSFLWMGHQHTTPIKMLKSHFSALCAVCAWLFGTPSACLTRLKRKCTSIWDSVGVFDALFSQGFVLQGL